MYQQMKNILTTIAAVLMLTAMVACGGNGRDGRGQDDVADADTTDSGSNVGRRDTLLIGLLPTLDCLPLYVAYDAGLTDSLSLPVAIVPFDNSFDCDDALFRGAIDLCVTDLVRGEWMKSRGADIVYLTSTDTYWQMVTNRKARLKSVRQMTDKMVATTRHSALAMFVDNVLDSAKVDKEYVFSVQINSPLLRLKMIENNEMDAAVLAEPQATAARLAGHPVLADSRSRGRQLGVVAWHNTDSSTSGSHRSDVILRTTTGEVSAAALLTVYDTAVDLINNKGVAAYAGIIGRHMGADGRIVAELDSMETACRAAGAAGLFSRSRVPLDKDIEAAGRYISDEK